MLPEQSLEKDILRMAARSQQSRLDNPRPEGLAPGTKGPSKIFWNSPALLSVPLNCFHLETLRAMLKHHAGGT